MHKDILLVLDKSDKMSFVCLLFYATSFVIKFVSLDCDFYDSISFIHNLERLYRNLYLQFLFLPCPFGYYDSISLEPTNFAFPKDHAYIPFYKQVANTSLHCDIFPRNVPLIIVKEADETIWFSHHFGIWFHTKIA